MKNSTRCLFEATCLSLALILLSTAQLHAGPITSVAAFTGPGPSAVIPFTGDGYLNNGAGLYPGDSYVPPPAINKGFPSLFIGGTVAVAPNALGGRFNYYDYIADQSDAIPNDGSTQNPQVIFRDVSVDPISPHTDLYVEANATSRFDNFSFNVAPDFASWGEALVLTSPTNVAAQLELEFVATVQRIGLFFNGNAGGSSFYTLDAFDINDILLGSTTVGDDIPPFSGNAAFIGWESLTIPIARVVVRETNALGVNVNNSSSPFFDDVRYEIFQVVDPPTGPTEIPEPSTLLLASFGLLGLAARRLRKSR